MNSQDTETNLPARIKQQILEGKLSHIDVLQRVYAATEHFLV